MHAAGAQYLRIVGPAYGFFGMGLALYFASQGAGRLLWPLLAGLIRLVIAIGGGWIALSLTGSLAWLFAALAFALVAYGADDCRRGRPRRLVHARRARHDDDVPSKTQDYDAMAAAFEENTAERRPRSFWVPVLCGAVILTIGIGARQSFGIFQKPIAAELGVGRELWSFANALSMLLMGLLSPFVGNIADRFGTARTVAAGGVVYVAGIFMIAAASEGVMLTAATSCAGSARRRRGSARSSARSAGRPRRRTARSRSASRRPADRSASSRSCRSPRCCSIGSTAGMRRWRSSASYRC